MLLQRTALLTVLIALFATGCASVPSHTTSTPSAPSQPPATADSGTTPPDTREGGAVAEKNASRESGENLSASDRPQHVMDTMEDLYNSGLEAHKAGRYSEARDYFDQAVETALNSDLEIDSNPALKQAYEELLENIDSLEGDLYQDGPERGEEPPKEELKDITSYLTPEEAEAERQKIQSAAQAVAYDLPVVLNTQVLTFIEAFQTRMRGPFEAGLVRSGRYLPMIKKIFAEQGLPTDLAYMAHQESAFKTSAYSRAKAKGLWQFIAPTARKYGLKRDVWVDERSDPEKSTRAAAAYLKDLYAMFGDWHLAMAAYNAGEGKIQRSMARTKTEDFWALAQHRRALRTETKNYVPAILASMVIDKAPGEYGFNVDPEGELAYDTVLLDSATDLRVIAECAGSSVETIQSLNPELRTMATPPYPSYPLRIPEGTASAFEQKYAAVPAADRLKWTTHEVSRGETLASISHKYRVGVSAILDANGMRSSRKLRVGQMLVIPISGAPVAKVSRAQMDEDAPTYDRGEKVIHRVRRGDTLQEIAVRYRTNVDSIQQWNRLSGTQIHPGQRLTVYYATRGVPAAEPSEAGTLTASGEYLVRRGDTLFSIAQRFGMSVGQLRSVNNLGKNSVIRPGDRLRVVDRERPENAAAGPTGPSSSSAGVIRYQIRKGDTLEQIASRLRVAVPDLMRWNNLSSADEINAGDILEIRAQ